MNATTSQPPRSSTRSGRSPPAAGSGLTATPYRRDQLDDLIALQLGPVRHTMTQAATRHLSTAPADSRPPKPSPARPPHRVPATPATPTRPPRAASPPSTATSPPTRPAISRSSPTSSTALQQGRHCLVLTQWTGHLDQLASALREHGHDPVSCAAAWAPKPVPPPSPASTLRARPAAAARRRHRPLHRRRLRLPRT